MFKIIKKIFLILLAFLFLGAPFQIKAKNISPPNLVEVRINDQFIDKTNVNLKNEETLNLIGTAEPNSKIYLYIYSTQPLIAITNADKDGNWVYALNQALASGSHKIEAETHKEGELSAKVEVLNFTVQKEKVEISKTIYYVLLALLAGLLIIMLIIKKATGKK